MDATALAARPDYGRRLFVFALLLVFGAIGVQYTAKLRHRSAFMRAGRSKSSRSTPGRISTSATIIPTRR